MATKKAKDGVDELKRPRSPKDRTDPLAQSFLDKPIEVMIPPPQGVQGYVPKVWERKKLREKRLLELPDTAAANGEEGREPDL